MSTTVSFTTDRIHKSDALVLAVYDGGVLGGAAKWFDGEMDGWVSHGLKSAPGFTGKTGQVRGFITPPGSPYASVILLGAGKPEALDGKTCALLGGPLVKEMEKLGVKSVHVVFDTVRGVPLDVDTAAAHLADGMAAGSYSFDKYRKKSAPQPPKTPPAVTMTVRSLKKAAAAHRPMSEVTKSVAWARDLVSEPGNVLYPAAYARRLENELAPLGVKVTVLDEKEMTRLGMNAALAVGQGSANPPCVVVMEYDGTKGAQKKPVALVGKGVTFDTGGISIKPGAGMDEMKMDMGGSAAVAGAVRALAANGAPVKIAAIVGLVENMPDGKSCRPGDIVTAMSGHTVEIDNTDAEGRLVLADLMEYVQKFHKPSVMLDFATLTGACVAALGTKRAGLFTMDDGLCREIEKAAADSGDKVWRLPLEAEHIDAMKGQLADLDNMGFYGRWAGASTAAGFLSKFVHEGVRWAHIDIAGPAMGTGGTGTGYGVRLIEKFAASSCEKVGGKKQGRTKGGPSPRPA